AALDEIVARARVSRTTFYVFFQNKEECLPAVYRLGRERIAEAIADAAVRTAEHGLSPPALIRAEVRATLAAYAADPALARIVLIEIVSATPAAEEAHAPVKDCRAWPSERRRSEATAKPASGSTAAGVSGQRFRHGWHGSDGLREAE